MSGTPSREFLAPGVGRPGDDSVTTVGSAAGVRVGGGGDNIESAKERAYSRLERISFQGAQWRRDISSVANQSTAQATG